MGGAMGSSHGGGGTVTMRGDDGMPILDNPARTAMERLDPEDTSKAHMVWLKGAAETHESNTTARVNKIAFYEQALLQPQRQELESSLERAKVPQDAA